MFSARKNGFAGIPCPGKDTCSLPNCLFKHSNGPEHDTPDAVEPATKRRRLDRSASPTKAPVPATKPERIHTHQSSRPEALQTQKAPAVGPKAPPTQPRLASSRISQAAKTPHVPIKAPITNTSKSSSPSHQYLEPLPLNFNPEGYGQRGMYLRKLHESMQSLNDRAKTSNEPEVKKCALDDEELADMAKRQEAKIATDSPVVYSNMIKTQLLAYRRLALSEWTKMVVEASNPSPQAAHSPAKAKRPHDEELNDALKRAVLQMMVTSQQGLEPFGFVTSLPTAEMIDEASKVEATNAGYEVCVRCGTRFQIFPDRREDGALTSGGKCEYHWGRPIYRKGAETVYRCCNGVVGQASTCTSSPCHTFEIKDAARQAKILQFMSTPDNDKIADDIVVAIDCEMGLTTKGNELIRVTALRWPSGEALLDFLVRPLGAILDFNTRFSGVSPQTFAGAKPYGIPGDDSDGLKICESPARAREHLFKHIKPTTILVGHAIENDLRAMRIIHPTIVDTALLCPHPRAALPIRRPLRDLAKQYLNRVIQTAGAAGHDSHEDAKATADVVEELVMIRYDALRRDGWKAENNKLVGPALKT